MSSTTGSLVDTVIVKLLPPLIGLPPPCLALSRLITGRRGPSGSSSSNLMVDSLVAAASVCQTAALRPERTTTVDYSHFKHQVLLLISVQLVCCYADVQKNPTDPLRGLV